MPRTQLLLAKKHFFPATRKLARREGGAGSVPQGHGLLFVLFFHSTEFLF